MNFRCGYTTAVGSGFEALVHHLATKHQEEVSMDEEMNYSSWREFDFILLLSGRGHKVKVVNFDMVKQ